MERTRPRRGVPDHEHNRATLPKAVDTLEQSLLKAIDGKTSGAVCVRVNFRNGRIGNIRVIRESDVS